MRAASKERLHGEAHRQQHGAQQNMQSMQTPPLPRLLCLLGNPPPRNGCHDRRRSRNMRQRLPHLISLMPPGGLHPAQRSGSAAAVRGSCTGARASGLEFQAWVEVCRELEAPGQG